MLYINGFVSKSSIKLWKAFFQFRISFRIFDRKPIFFSKELPGVNIDQIAMCHISMDSSRQALQNNGKLFFIFQFRFQIICRKQKNIQTS